MKKRVAYIMVSLAAMCLADFGYSTMNGIYLTSAFTSKAWAQTHQHGAADAPAQPAPPAADQPSVEVPTVEIPVEQQKVIGLNTVAAEIKPMLKILRTVGLVEYDERRLATVNTKFEGWIEKLYVDYTGKYVSQGEPLADIYSPELLATQKELLSVSKWAKGGGGMLAGDSRAILEAARERLRLWDVTEHQIRKIEQTGKPMRTLTIHSPISGYVVQKMAVKGTRVMPGEKLFDIADLSTVWILSDIFEYELPLIKVGEKAIITLSNFAGKEFESKIDYVYPTVSGETRSVKARFTIPNPGNALLPLMHTNVEVKINLGDRLIIPEDSVLDAGKRQVVYIDKGDGYFEPREVSVGLKAVGMIEITKGLKPGERVVSSANFLIDSEAKLKGIVK